MGRGQLKTERLEEAVAKAIIDHSYGSITAWWRKHLQDSDVSLQEFSSALKRDPAKPETIEIILEAVSNAAKEMPYREIETYLCPQCGFDISGLVELPIIPGFNHEA